MRWCELNVPGDPIAKGRPRHGRNGHTFTPARTRNAEEALGSLLRAVCPRPTSLPVAVTLEFRCATWRATDIDNFVKLVLDAGNTIVWDDDRQVVELHVQVVRASSSPGTSIEVDTVHRSWWSQRKARKRARKSLPR